MNSSTGMPLSTWMFLNTVSDIWGFAVAAAAAAVWPFAGLNVPAMWIGIAVPGANFCDDVTVVAPVANAIVVSHATVSTVAPRTSHLDKNFMRPPTSG